jgi:hypothetical protein
MGIPTDVLFPVIKAPVKVAPRLDIFACGSAPDKQQGEEQKGNMFAHA